jgi:hypothetical protein
MTVEANRSFAAASRHRIYLGQTYGTKFVNGWVPSADFLD